MNTVMVVGQQHSTAQHWVECGLDSSLQQHSLGLIFMPVHMPGSLWAWPRSHILEATLIWTLLGWGRGLSAPPLQPLAFVPLVGLACPGRWLAMHSFLPGLVAGWWWYLALCAVQVGWDVDDGHSTPTAQSLVPSLLEVRGGLSKSISSLSFSFPILKRGC